MKWENVALCNACWEKRNPNRKPVRLTEPKGETCHDCAKITYSGIYVRTDVDVEPNIPLSVVDDMIREARKKIAERIAFRISHTKTPEYLMVNGGRQVFIDKETWEQARNLFAIEAFKEAE